MKIVLYCWSTSHDKGAKLEVMFAHSLLQKRRECLPPELVVTQYDVTLGLDNLVPLFDSRGTTVNDILGMSVIPAMHHLNKG